MKVKKLNHEMEHEEFMGSVSRANPSLHYLPCIKTINDKIPLLVTE